MLVPIAIVFTMWAAVSGVALISIAASLETIVKHLKDTPNDR